MMRSILKSSEHLSVFLSLYHKSVISVPIIAKRHCAVSWIARRNMSSFRTSGIGVAPITPFKPNGDLNLSLYDDMASYLQRTNVNHVFVNGTIGEGNSMTIEERKQSAEAWVKSCKGKIQYVVVHIGSGNLRESKELATHAQSIGADAISAVTPTYYKPANESVLVDYMAEVAAAAPKTPFYYYDISFVTGLEVNVARFFELAKDRIPTLVGIKHSSRDLSDQQECALFENGRYHVMIGTFDGYLPALSYGVDVPLAAPYTGEMCNALKDAFDTGNLGTARKIQDRMVKLNSIVRKHGSGGKSFTAVKEAFSILSGVDAGPVRLPLLGFSPKEKDAFTADLRSSGFLK